MISGQRAPLRVSMTSASRLVSHRHMHAARAELLRSCRWQYVGEALAIFRAGAGQRKAVLRQATRIGVSMHTQLRLLALVATETATQQRLLNLQVAPDRLLAARRQCMLAPRAVHAASAAQAQHEWERRTWKPLGARLPLTDCWPTQATIWAMLMGDPLLPHWLMMSGLLCAGSVLMHTCESPGSVSLMPWLLGLHKLAHAAHAVCSAFAAAFSRHMTWTTARRALCSTERRWKLSACNDPSACCCHACTRARFAQAEAATWR